MYFCDRGRIRAISMLLHFKVRSKQLNRMQVVLIEVIACQMKETSLCFDNHNNTEYVSHAD